MNADDLIGGPVTVTVSEVRKGAAEQPVDVHLAEFPGRPYRPSKSMRRVLASVWGAEASEWTGRRMTLYRDPEVVFGREKVGGIKISHLSHMEKKLTIALTVTRGKRAPHTVEPLVEVPTPAAPTPEQVAASTDQNELRDWWKQHAHLRDQITARVNELNATPAQPELGDPA